MGEITLTESQSKALEFIKKWVKSKNTEGPGGAIEGAMMSLEGKAGTGKTTLMREFLKWAEKNSLVVVGAALSHEASNVLREMSIPIVHTTAACYEMKPVIDKDTGQRTFQQVKSGGYNMSPAASARYGANVIVIDESSMVDYKMLSIISDYKNYSKRKQFKVIFVGDSHQLPPPGGKTKGQGNASPVFDLPNRVVLKEIVRTDDDAITDFTNYLADKIENNVLSLPPSWEDYFSKDSVEYITRPEAIELAVRDPGKVSIVGYRNVLVDAYNARIRSLLYPDSISKYEKGERVISYAPSAGEIVPTWSATNQSWYISQPNSGEGIKNGKKTEVLDVMPYTVNLSKAFINNLPANMDSQVITIECYRLILSGIDIPILVPYEHESSKIAKIKNMLRSVAIEQKSSYLWKRYYSFLDMFGDLRPAHARTIYKAQGLTLDTVIVDYPDIVGTGPLKTLDKIKALYTAASRAKRRLYVITKI